MEDFIRRIPKAELHVHLEGTMAPELLLKLANKNNIHIPMSLEELYERRKHFTCLEDFVHDYHTCCEVIKDADDFYEVLFEYLKYCHTQGITYVEMGITGLTHPNTPFEVQMTGLKRAAEEAYNLYGIKCGFLLIFVRHMSVEQNLRLLQDAIPFKDSIVGCGLAGIELKNPAPNFKEVFEETKRQGLCGADGGNISIHTGEEGDPASIIDALYAVRPRRLDHGVRSLEDPHLMKFLANTQIPLTVSPLSNKSLKVLDKFFNGRHIIRELMDNNLKVCLNSDDPAFFGGGVLENFLAVANSLSDQGDEEIRKKIVELCRNSFDAAFLSKDERDELTQRIDEFLRPNR